MISVPGEPKRVRVETINSTAIRVTWNPPAEDERNGMIRGYQVHYGKLDENNEYQGPVSTIDERAATMVIVTGLQPESTYQFTVNAYTRKGDGDRSRPKQATTKGAGGYFCLYYVPVRRLF